MYTKKVNVLPDQISGPLMYEVQRTFENVQTITYSETANSNLTDNVPIDTDLGFLNLLAALMASCNSPCNFFNGVGDSCGFHGNAAQSVSNNTSPLWDAACAFVHAPLDVTIRSFNKIAPGFIEQGMALKMATENVYRNGISPFFTPDRIAREKAALAAGQDPHANTNSVPFATD